MEDSNIAGIGSDENRALRKAAAESEECFKGAGAEVGLQIWRVENKRTESDTPDFGIAHWPKDEYGNFYKGDSYLLMNTYKEADSDKLLFDVHFWLGESSSQDEVGVAAYKAVELDDLLDDVPVQHREVMGHESALFQGLFKSGVQYMDGGIASGFRHVEPESYEPRLLQVRKTKRCVRATQVPVAAASMNHGDVYVLDAGLKVYMWAGDAASPFERAKGAALQHNIVAGRNGKSDEADNDDGAFWAALGDESDVQAAVEQEAAAEDVDAAACSLHKLSDSSGSLTFADVASGNLSRDMLDDADVFVVNAGIEVFVWVGAAASDSEKTQAMKYAEAFLESSGLPRHTPITRVKSGQANDSFADCFA